MDPSGTAMKYVLGGGEANWMKRRTKTPGLATAF
jgi:hypothetical protein